MRAPGRFSPSSHDQIEDDLGPGEVVWPDVEHEPKGRPVGFQSMAQRIQRGERSTDLTAAAKGKAGDRYDLRKRAH